MGLNILETISEQRGQCRAGRRIIEITTQQYKWRSGQRAKSDSVGGPCLRSPAFLRRLIVAVALRLEVIWYQDQAGPRGKNDVILRTVAGEEPLGVGSQVIDVTPNLDDWIPAQDADVDAARIIAIDDHEVRRRELELRAQHLVIEPVELR